MDNQVITTISSTGGAVIVGLGGMWITAHQLGKRMDDLRDGLSKRMDDFGRRLDRLEESFTTFRDMMNSKLAAMDLEIARILDKIGGAK
jgi:predicted RNA-binding protein with PIN domain